MDPQNKKSQVWITKQISGETDRTTTLRALKTFNAKKLFDGTEHILIKPNWIIAEHYSRGNVTSTETMAGIVKYLIEECFIPPKNIIVGDGGYPSETEKTIELNEVSRLKTEFGIEIRNLNNEKMIEKHPLEPFALKSVNIAEIAEKVDVIISVPSLKTHSMAITTLSMKNLMGSILPKGIMHSKLPMKIADLCSLFRSKMRLSIIDGIIGSDGMEEGGNPVKMGLIIISEDPVALDAVGSAIIGYPPSDVPYLSFAEKKHLGTADLNKIEIIGPKITDVYRKFDR